MMKTTVAKFGLLAGGLVFAGGLMFAGGTQEEDPPSIAQVVALDECDPGTFNTALGPDFCKNVALGAATKLSDLFAKAAAGTPDSGWDFEPDTLNIKKGTTLTVVDQGGEPHTFTEVAQFGGGFLPVLNAPGEETVSECAGGFSFSNFFADPDGDDVVGVDHSAHLADMRLRSHGQAFDFSLRRDRQEVKRANQILFGGHDKSLSI